MQPDIDAQLTNFYEDAPPREFATVMRGYDRHQVDEHIRQIEAAVRQHREHAQAMQRELSKAAARSRSRSGPPIPASAPGSGSCCGCRGTSHRARPGGQV
jgi:DivIVA domain-containing protein